MEDTAKYLIHATIAADGVVERSDVVGAVFGQTEGLLGEELDLRDLQESSKVGRIDVAVESENGQSFGEVTVASSLDKVETAILGAALETIDRIGPCQASVEVTSIEDVRAAKRREVVERAKELLADGFEETSLASTDVLEEVRDAARVEGIVDYEGLPAGPRVGDSDAVIVVEGRADVLALLEGGIKNAIAVEGTNVPDAVAELSRNRTVTAFLDGDRGGELILRELAQVGDVDYVAFAPPGESVEDLNRGAVFEALRGKVPYETLADERNLREAAADRTRKESTRGGTGRSGRDAGADRGRATSDDPATTDDGEPIGDESTADESIGNESTESESSEGETGESETGQKDGASDSSDETGGGADAAGLADDEASDDDGTAPRENGAAAPRENGTLPDEEPTADGAADAGTDVEGVADVDDDLSEAPTDDEPRSLEEHVQEVIDAGSGLARLLASDLSVRTEVDAAAAFDAVDDAVDPPHTVVVDGEMGQRLLDVAAQRGVSDLFGRETGEFVKRPVGVRVRTVGDLRADAEGAVKS